MVTTIEVGKFKIEKTVQNGRKGEKYCIQEDRELIGMLPDEPGVYPVKDGVISLGFSQDEKGHKFVDLNLGECKELGRYLKRSKERHVNISNEGSGNIFLPHGRVLLVSTSADPSKFTQRK